MLFRSTVGTVTEEIIRQYIANQKMEDGDENFKVADEFQSLT